MGTKHAKNNPYDELEMPGAAGLIFSVHALQESLTFGSAMTVDVEMLMRVRR